jgi:hypothetical protein
MPCFHFSYDQHKDDFTMSRTNDFRLFIASALVLALTLGERVPLEGLLSESDETFFSGTELIMRTARQMENLEVRHHRQRYLQTSDAATQGTALQQLCRSIEDNFFEDVACECVGALASGTLSFSCTYTNPICGPNGTVCGRPQIAATLVDDRVFSATSCIKEYVNTQRNITYDDTCVSIELCENDLSYGFCGCTVSYGSQACQTCAICDDKKGIQMDCTNINADVVSTQCKKVDSDLNLAGGAGFIAGFLPNFAGFCSHLEDGVDGRIGCDCSNSAGGTFQVTCETKKDQECREAVCADVKSTVSVVDGAIVSVKACSDFKAPFDYKETCTTVEMCSAADPSVCQCSASYDGVACNSCEVCAGEKQGIMLNCSNVDFNAFLDTCQEVSEKSSYEFIPNFLMAPAGFPGTGTSSAVGCFVGTSIVALGAVLSALLL